MDWLAPGVLILDRIDYHLQLMACQQVWRFRLPYDGNRIPMMADGFFPIHLLRRQHLSPALLRCSFSVRQASQVPFHAPDQRLKLFFPATNGSLSLPRGADWYRRYLALDESLRPPMRTFTIRALRRGMAELDIDFALHGESGPASRWALHAAPGAVLWAYAPLTQPPAGFAWRPPQGVRQILLIADECALPAAAGILESLAGRPCGPEVRALLEVPTPQDQIALPQDRRLAVTWLPRSVNNAAYGEPMSRAVRELDGAWKTALAVPGPALRQIDPDRELIWELADEATTTAELYAWIAGEAAAIVGIRRYLIQQRGLPSQCLSCMGYWRLGRALS